jgi:hypothetical protein
MTRVTGLWVYQSLDARLPDPDTTVARARRHGIKWLTAEAFKNGQPLNDDWLRRLRHATKEHGMRLGVHGYIGRPHPAPAIEAKLMAAAIDVAQADFAIIDAEDEYERSSKPASKQFVDAYRELKPHFRSYFSSFGRPSLHASLNWRAWAHAGFRGMPQAYENSNPQALTPAKCVDDWAKIFARRGLRPTLGCFTPEQGHRLPVHRLVASVREVSGLPFNVYRHGTVTDAELEALSAVE